jgi:hypothetical protein
MLRTNRSENPSVSTSVHVSPQAHVVHVKKEPEVKRHHEKTPHEMFAERKRRRQQAKI